jgi:hypothetical protein
MSHPATWTHVRRSIGGKSGLEAAPRRATYTKGQTGFRRYPSLAAPT